MPATPVLGRASRAPPAPGKDARKERAASDARFGERALVVRLRHGDPVAYETLVEAHGPRMLAVARRYLHSPEDAEDVVQSAFVQVVRFVHRFEGASQLTTWLHRIVANCALMRIRGRSRHPEAHLDASAFENGSIAEPALRAGSSVEDDLSRRETHERLRRAVGRLPDRVRAAVRLRFVDGLTFSETARLLGRSHSAVKTSVQRGLTMLQTVLASDGGSGSRRSRRG